MPPRRKVVLAVTKIYDRYSWRLVYGRAPHRAKFAIGQLIASDNPALAELEAEALRLELAAARTRGEWPAWARAIPSVARLIDAEADARLNGPLSATERSRADAAAPVVVDGAVTSANPPPRSGGLYDRYAADIALSVDPSWKASQLAFLREFTEVRRVPLAGATPAHIQAFLAHILQTPGPPTAKRHAKALERWRRARRRLGMDPDTGRPLEAGERRPSGPPPKRAVDERPEPPPSRTIATRNHALRALRKFYQWAVRDGAVAADPTAGLKKLTEPPPEQVVVLTHAERAAFLAAAAREPDGLAVAIGLYAGLRRAEIIRADWKHIRLDTRNIRVPRHKRGGEQTPRIRRVPISDALLALLNAVPEARRAGPVIDWPKTLPARRKAAGELMGRLAARSETAGVAREKFDWNALRHTFCTGHLDAGVSPGVIIQWSGHTEKVFWTNYAGHIREYDDRINRVDDVARRERDESEGGDGREEAGEECAEDR